MASSSTPSSSSQQHQQQQIIIDQALAAASMDFSDVLYYSNPNACGGFKRVAEDTKRSIFVSSKPMSISPINMMRASTIMPCSPSEFVRYMEPDARVLWDEHYKHGFLVRRVRPMGAAAATTDGGGATEKSGTAASASLNTSSDFPQLKIFEFNSPVPSLIRNRDFEMVMCQKINAVDGTALVKGFSTPKGYLLPLRYKKGSEAEGQRSEAEALRQRNDRFKSSIGADISSLQTASMQSIMKAAKAALDASAKGTEPTNLEPPRNQTFDDARLPGFVGVPAFDTSSLEATVRGTILFSGFVALPIFENDHETLNGLHAETRKMIAAADRNRQAAGTLAPQSPHFAYPYVTSVEGKGRIIACRVTYIALIQPQGNVHPMFVNIVVRMQTRGLKSMQRAIVQHPVKALDEALTANGGVKKKDLASLYGASKL